jgi:hypothetical protein
VTEDQFEDPKSADEPVVAVNLDQLDVPDDDLDDSVFPTSYLASLAQELTAAVEDWDSLTAPQQDAIRSTSTVPPNPA